MNLPLVVRCAWFASVSSLGVAAPIAADSHLAAVTIYADRAVVTRTAQVNVGTGVVEVAFEKLPAQLLDQSLQVAGRGEAEAQLLEVAAHPTFVEFATNDRVKALEDQIRSVVREDGALADRSGVLAQQRDYVVKIQSATTTPSKDGGLANTPLESWTKLLAFSEGQLNQIATELRTIGGQREELKARREALEQQLNELRGQSGRSYKHVLVRLNVSRGGALELTLRYAVPDASWTPSYDARVLSAEHTVQLGYFGLVRQSTGEDWSGVDLTLSTARPSLGGGAPELSPWVVQQREIMPMAAADETLQFNESVARSARKTTLAAAPQVRAELRDLGSAVTAIESHATSATFRIAEKADIPSDNAPHKVGIATVPLRGEFTYAATPKLIPAAFLSASATNSSEYPLLGGALNEFLDETFVASSALAGVMPGEKFDLALGADEGIAIKRKLNNRFTEDTGLMTKGKRITYDVTLTVQNNKKTAEKIVVQDQLPVSRHEKIVVKLLAPDAREVKPDANGMLKWTLSLNPGEKRELPLKFSVEYPTDLPVSGLE